MRAIDMSRFHHKPRCVRDFACDKAFSNVSARQIKMSERAAELAGRVETRDGIAIDIDHALLGVVHGPALRVGERRPHRRAIEGWHSDRRHRAAGTSKIFILGALALCVPSRDAVFDGRCVKPSANANSASEFARLRIPSSTSLVVAAHNA